MVPSTALVAQIASTLTAAVVLTDGWAVDAKPAIVRDVSTVGEFYGIVWRLDSAPLDEGGNHARHEGLASIQVQVTVVAPTQLQANRALDRVSRTLTETVWSPVTDDAGVWERSCRWLSIDVEGEPFVQPRPVGPFQAVGRYRGVAALDPE